MSPLPTGEHAGSGAASDQTAIAEPAFAERARTLMYLGRVGISRHCRAGGFLRCLSRPIHKMF